MSKIIRFAFCLCLFLTGSISRSDTLDAFIVSLPEHEFATKWVVENSGKTMTYETASKIVSAAYANGHSQRVEPSLIIAIMKQDSGFRQYARSNRNALGLMQVMPRWHSDKLRGRNPYSIDVSIEVGTIVIRDCLAKHKNDKTKALNCYSGSAKNYPMLVQRYQRQMVQYVARNRFNNEPETTYFVAAK